MSADIEGLMTAYLDALRNDDQAAATGVVETIDQRLAAIQLTLDAELSVAAESARAEFIAANEKLELLLG